MTDEIVVDGFTYRLLPPAPCTFCSSDHQQIRVVISSYGRIFFVCRLCFLRDPELLTKRLGANGKPRD